MAAEDLGYTPSGMTAADVLEAIRHTKALGSVPIRIIEDDWTYTIAGVTVVDGAVLIVVGEAIGEASPAELTAQAEVLGAP